MKFLSIISLLAFNAGLSLALPEGLASRDLSMTIHITDEDKDDKYSGCLRMCHHEEGLACPANMKEEKIGECYTCCLKKQKQPKHGDGDGDDHESTSRNHGQDVLSELDEIHTTCIKRPNYCCTWSGCADCCRDTWSGGYAACNTGWNPFSNEGTCEMYR